MADATIDTRNSRGEWQPETLPKPGALFRWPPDPVAIFKFLFGYEGLLWPFNLVQTNRRAYFVKSYPL